MLEKRNLQMGSTSEMGRVKKRIGYGKLRQRFTRCCVYMLIELHRTEWKTAHKSHDLFFPNNPLTVCPSVSFPSLHYSRTFAVFEFLANIIQMVRRAWYIHGISLKVEYR